MLFQGCNTPVAGPTCCVGQGIPLVTQQILTVWGVSDVGPSLRTKCWLNAFIDHGPVCMVGWGHLFLKAGEVILYPVFPWQGKLLWGVLNPARCFPLVQPFEPADEMPALKGTSHSQFWQCESSELQQEEIG